VVTKGCPGGELWVADLSANSMEALLPDLTVTSYDISNDGAQIVFASLAADGKSHIWLTRADRRAAPRQLFNDEAFGPAFLGKGGEICFRGRDGAVSYIYVLNLESGQTRKLVADAALDPPTASPDGNWIVSTMPAANSDTPTTMKAYPKDGGTPLLLCPRCSIKWTRDQKFIFFSFNTGFAGGSMGGRTAIIPLAPGKAFPSVPPAGFKSEADLRKLPGVRIVEHRTTVFPGLNAEVWAYENQAVQRNLYRINLP
jgi:hypothetical protein